MNETWAGGKDTVMDYDLEGNMVRRSVDGKYDTSASGGYTGGRTTRSTFDPLGRETRTAVERGGSERDRITVTEYDYDPYGELDQRRHTDAELDDPDPEQQLSPEAKDNPFRYEGFYYDSGVKTYDMQARSYRPEIGRFLTSDRLESASGDFNLEADPITGERYSFAGGNPINRIEFDGHEPRGSFTNGCDNTYGSASRCRGESRGRQRRSRHNQARYTWAYSNNWRSGQATSPEHDREMAKSTAERTVRASGQDIRPATAPQKPQKPPGYGNSPIERIKVAGGEDPDQAYEEAQRGRGRLCGVATDLLAYLGSLTCLVGNDDSTFREGRDEGHAASPYLSVILGGRGGFRPGAGARLGAREGGTALEAGVTEAGGAASSALSRKLLSRQLASEEQMAGPGTRIIGAGTARKLTDAPRLARQYGGNPSDWTKMTSGRYRDGGGTFDLFETHWYENVRTGARYEFKTKFPRAENVFGGAGG